MRRVVRRGSLRMFLFAARLLRAVCQLGGKFAAIASADNAPSTKFYREPAVAGPNASNPVYDRRGAQVAADRINGDD